LICSVKIKAASSILGTVSTTSGIMGSDVAACVFVFQKAFPVELQTGLPTTCFVYQ